MSEKVLGKSYSNIQGDLGSVRAAVGPSSWPFQWRNWPISGRDWNLTDDQLNLISNACNSATDASAPYVSGDVGGVWFYSRIRDTGYYHLMTPNSPTCRSASWGDGLLTTWPASSLHPGGANVVYLDGSVRFVSHDIELRIWRAQGTPMGNDYAGSAESVTNL